MKTAIMAFLLSTSIMAQPNCKVCISVEPNLSLLHIDIDPIKMCESPQIEKMSCNDLILTIGTEGNSEPATLGDKKIPIKYSFQISSERHEKYLEHFLDLKESNSNIEVEMESNQAYSVFSVTIH